MVVDTWSEADVDAIFHALADATRRDILTVASGDGLSVSSLARRYPISFAAVQKHVAVLERAGLVTKAPRGRERLVCTNIDALGRARQLLDAIEAQWRSRIDRIDGILAADHPAPGGTR